MIYFGDHELMIVLFCRQAPVQTTNMDGKLMRYYPELNDTGCPSEESKQVHSSPSEESKQAQNSTSEQFDQTQSSPSEQFDQVQSSPSEQFDQAQSSPSDNQYDPAMMALSSGSITETEVESFVSPLPEDSDQLQIDPAWNSDQNIADLASAELSDGLPPGLDFADLASAVLPDDLGADLDDILGPSNTNNTIQSASSSSKPNNSFPSPSIPYLSKASTPSSNRPSTSSHSISSPIPSTSSTESYASKCRGKTWQPGNRVPYKKSRTQSFSSSDDDEDDDEEDTDYVPPHGSKKPRKNDTAYLAKKVQMSEKKENKRRGRKTELQRSKAEYKKSRIRPLSSDDKDNPSPGSKKPRRNDVVYLPDSVLEMKENSTTNNRIQTEQGRRKAEKDMLVKMHDTVTNDPMPPKWKVIDSCVENLEQLVQKYNALQKEWNE